MLVNIQRWHLLWLFFLLLRAVPAQSQCAIGQTPSSAFPICGTATLHMTTVPACTGKTIPVTGCNAATGYTDINAFWYKFTCYSSGTLAFTIVPMDQGDDYDWQLFDITNHPANDVYTDASLVVTGNWAGTFGNTGASAAGVTWIECASIPSDNRPTFSSMPTLIDGHQYLLMVSHYTVTNQSGYDLNFTGGTASITDPTVPHLLEKNYSCNTQKIGIKLSKPVKCNSLAPDGSDFKLNGSRTAQIVSAAGINCSNGFDLDSVELQLNTFLTPGDYTVTSAVGSDGNTLLDYCDKPLPVNEELKFTVFSPAPVFIDSLVTLPCAPNQIQIVFTLPIDCNTIASDGSDFIITGPSGVTVTRAQSSCINNNASNLITLTLSRRITVGGTYTVSIVTGSDGNGLATKCGAYILAGSNQISFTLAQQPFSALKAVLPVGCRTQRVKLALSQPVQCSSISTNGSDFSITGPTAVSITGVSFSCTNNFTDSVEFQLAQPILTAGNYTIAVKQGSDGNTLLTSCWQETPVGNNIRFVTRDTVNADFRYTTMLHCDYDTVALTHDGRNSVNSWRWFYDGTDSSHKQHPFKIYTKFGIKNISLIVSNGTCSDTSAQQIDLTNVLEAAFRVSSDTICPNDVVIFTNNSTGNIVQTKWDFGNGRTSSAIKPPNQNYPLPLTRQKLYPVQLVVQSNLNCFDTAVRMLRVLNSCYVAVPTAFTPNGDGLNDYLYPLNGFKTIEMEFKVFNRLGQLVFVTKDWTKKWDGRFKGDPQPPGTYVWEFTYTHKDSGRKMYEKGTAVLIR